tara:strand:+ start:81 stop:1430 length:1350 start_codon:yes stop_codon:yes gene_type:complete
MPTISPSYQMKGVVNPYYTMDPSVTTVAKNALKKVGIDVNAKDILFKCVNQVQGKIVNTSQGKYLFQLALDTSSDLAFGMKVTKRQVKGHFGMATRKDSTASSNVNEFLTVYFLVNPQMNPKELEDYSCVNGSASTGVLTGEGSSVSFEDLCMLLDKDESAERDIKIGLNNAKAVTKDIQGKGIANLYWVPRGKPRGISPKTPSDVIIQFTDGTFRGYSNKISAGKDETPKFNTNIYAFFGKLGDSFQQDNIGGIIDGAWNKAAQTITTPTAKAALDSFDISGEKFSESISKLAFTQLAQSFRADGLDFYTEGFYYKFRNNLISDFAESLTSPSNMVYFLNTIYFYTYDDPRTTFTPCPYKLLIGRENSISSIKDISSDQNLKELLFNKDPNKLSSIQSTYDNKSQSFEMKFKYNNKNIKIPITCRTRSAGGWSGKSLFITTSGVKLVN